MPEHEQAKYLAEREQVKSLLRDEQVKHYPIIIKASTAGTLETLVKEAQRLMHGLFRVHIQDYGVGPVTEGDMENALRTGAVIFAFDVGCQHAVERAASTQGLCVKMHKLIQRFTEDVGNFVHDA